MNPATTPSHAGTRAILGDLWSLAGGDPVALSQTDLTGAEPILPSSFRVDVAAQATIAASGLAAAEIWRTRTGQTQRVAVAMRHAAAEFRSDRYLMVDGAAAGEHWDKIAGPYQCGDGRWVRLHTNFPHHRDGVLELLQCAHDRAAVKNALKSWTAEAFEAAAADAGLVVAMMRPFEEWDAHAQGRAVASLPPFTIERIADAPVRGFADGAKRPLSGVRVLDLTRVIAGPVSGRTLAAHGADVLNIASPKLPAIDHLVIDTNRGKLTAHLDLTSEAGRERLRALIADADVLVQGYHPGGLERLGFGPLDLAKLRPGIVYVTLSAYSHAGPWAMRRGFDSLVQTATGFNHAEAQAAGQSSPKVLPCQAVDHASGYLLAFGAMTALLRRASQGGSWHVRVSLAQTAYWLRGLGRLPDGLKVTDQCQADIVDLMEVSTSGFGRLSAVRHAATLPATPARWERPSMPLGSHPAEWPAG